MSKNEKRLGKSHWRESRMEAANLNQKGGPMNDGKAEKLEKARQQADEEELHCGSCGARITHADIACQEGMCNVCFNDHFGDDFEDTLDDPRLPAPPESKPTEFEIIHNWQDPGDENDPGDPDQ